MKQNSLGCETFSSSIAVTCWVRCHRSGSQPSAAVQSVEGVVAEGVALFHSGGYAIAILIWSVACKLRDPTKGELVSNRLVGNRGLLIEPR